MTRATRGAQGRPGGGAGTASVSARPSRPERRPETARGAESQAERPAATEEKDKALPLGPWSCSHDAGADARW